MTHKTGILKTLGAFFLPLDPAAEGISFDSELLHRHAKTYKRRSITVGLSLFAVASVLQGLEYIVVGWGVFVLSCLFGLAAGFFLSATQGE